MIKMWLSCDTLWKFPQKSFSNGEKALLHMLSSGNECHNEEKLREEAEIGNSVWRISLKLFGIKPHRR